MFLISFYFDTLILRDADVDAVLAPTPGLQPGESAPGTVRARWVHKSNRLPHSGVCCTTWKSAMKSP